MLSGCWVAWSQDLILYSLCNNSPFSFFVALNFLVVVLLTIKLILPQILHLYRLTGRVALQIQRGINGSKDLKIQKVAGAGYSDDLSQNFFSFFLFFNLNYHYHFSIGRWFEVLLPFRHVICTMYLVIGKFSMILLWCAEKW